MKALDFILIIACIASLVAVYFAESAELRAVFHICAVICGVALGVRFGLRLRKDIEDKK